MKEFVTCLCGHGNKWQHLEMIYVLILSPEVIKHPKLSHSYSHSFEFMKGMFRKAHQLKCHHHLEMRKKNILLNTV